jgi:formylmethanofuran dehydrogenase subunit E
MVDLAYKHLPEGEYYDALCETRACLPDAIQLLTPCTIGNGWLRIVDLGRFALILYEKRSGVGIRVFVDPQKLEPFPELQSWFLKLKSKKEIDYDQLLDEIREAGSAVCGLEEVRVDLELVRREQRERFSICPSCHESYPSAHGPLCRGCRQELPYRSGKGAGDVAVSEGSTLKAASVERVVSFPPRIEER